MYSSTRVGSVIDSSNNIDSISVGKYYRDSHNTLYYYKIIILFKI